MLHSWSPHLQLHEPPKLQRLEIKLQDFTVGPKAVPIFPSPVISALAATPRSADVARIIAPAPWDPTAAQAPSNQVAILVVTSTFSFYIFIVRLRRRATHTCSAVTAAVVLSMLEW